MGLPRFLTMTDLVAGFRAMGVKGRHVLCHASYKAIGQTVGGPGDVPGALFEAVGDTGAVLFPTYDFESWTEGKAWSRPFSPSRMGIITELARRQGRFMRTSHPMLSYAVSHAHSVRGLYMRDVPSAHGPGSVFDQLVKQRGLLISIGADKQRGFRPNDVGFTIANHAATLADAPWRKLAIFGGTYQDNDGSESLRYYVASVNADPSRYVTEVTPGHLKAEKEGIIRRMPLGEADCWVADARTFVEWAVESHKTNPELWRREI